MSFFKSLRGNIENMILKCTREQSDGVKRPGLEDLEDVTDGDGTKLVYFASTTRNENMIDILRVLKKDVQVSLEFILRIRQFHN
jgi:hypothetical protein